MSGQGHFGGSWRIRRNVWVGGDPGIPVRIQLSVVEVADFSSQFSKASKLARCPPAFGGGEPLVAVQCRQAPQLFDVARRQVHPRHQVRAGRADPQQVPTAPARPRLLWSAAPRQLDHVSAGARWRRPFPMSPGPAGREGIGHGGTRCGWTVIVPPFWVWLWP
jgi:hypothetical protein